ncbi:SDR family NAD(P)-dependent oxidoreductase, partial [Streptomyces sp. NPDC056161]|uniref:SDR family NAD(P)-dependent oxidoreductase n=1 Tax=Streptomyces sp. NPDC056161 TaxID=3345732 RepID=UPI0035DCC844
THVDLPTYPFQRTRYWLDIPDTPTDATGLGQDPGHHGLLAAVVDLADDGGTVFTGRLALDTVGWLADHAVLDSVLLPGAALAELALNAAEYTGTTVEELVIEAPLVVPDEGASRLRVSVGPADAGGGRSLTVDSRPSDDDGPWLRHATGTLADSAAAPGPTRIPDDPELGSAGSWPPADALRIDLADAYSRLADHGLHYGPMFQGLTALWTRGDDDLFAEVSLPEGTDIDGFAVHPALLDSALHPAALRNVNDGQLQLPFSWAGLVLSGDTASGPVSAARVRLTRTGTDAYRLVLADTEGRSLFTVERLTSRPIDPARLAAARPGAAAPAVVTWVPLPTQASDPMEASDPEPRWALFGAVTDTMFEHCDQYSDVAEVVAAVERGEGPEFVVLPVPATEIGGSLDLPSRVRAVLGDVTAVLQAWLPEDRLAEIPLVVRTVGAVDMSDGLPVDIPAAAVWGLIRAAQREEPGRLFLVDVDTDSDTDTDPEADHTAVPSFMAAGRPETVARAGVVHEPRLVRTAPGAGVDTDPPADLSTGTVLVTGAAGTLGAVVARHLAAAHGARDLLLVGRRPADDPAVLALQADLATLGATGIWASCDVGDRAALAAVLAAIPIERPLTAVFHAAGTLEDALVANLDPGSFDTVLRPKADAAWHLHELTRGADLGAFVLFSSLAGTLGSAGQANYAAANAFLDGLAALRRAEGLPAHSLAWGLWQAEGGMAADVDRGAGGRMRRAGVLPLSAETGVALLDAALLRSEPALVTASFDNSALREQAAGGTLPGLLHGFAPTGNARNAGSRTGADGAARRASAESPDRLVSTLSGIPEKERRRVLLDLVRRHTAVVLAYPSPETLEIRSGLLDLGFDSLTAVELRNRLAAATGLRLPSTLLFDHPTIAELADHLHDRLDDGPAAAVDAVLAELDRLRTLVAALPGDGAGRSEIDRRLEDLLRLRSRPGADAPPAAALDGATDEELFSVLDEELGLT